MRISQFPNGIVMYVHQIRMMHKRCDFIVLWSGVLLVNLIRILHGHFTGTGQSHACPSASETAITISDNTYL